MCELCPPPDRRPDPPPRRITRRALLATGAAVAGGAVLARTTSAQVAPRTEVAAALAGVAPVTMAPGLAVLPRDAWGADLPPVRPVPLGETVKFLLVHHTASTNSYAAGAARNVIRSTYSFHTSAAKGWPDVCYEFFVDRYGVVWEGRQGALAGPVVADATGGSQGFAQLVCVVGDFTSVQPTPAAMTSLTRTLAFLADRYQLDTRPGAATSFVSRGSQRWRAGVTVTTPTIAGHRDMSYTSCPGNAFYPVVHSQLQAMVHAERARMAAAQGDTPRAPYRVNRTVVKP